MQLARHGTGPMATVRALASQVHPVFMLPPLGASAFGAVLARDFALDVALLHLGVAFCAIYTAHVKDGYVDFHGRGEDDDHPLTVVGCRVALAGATVLFFLGTVLVGLVAGVVAVALTLPGWVIGFLHAPHLDTNPATTTMGYPLGIGFALLGGYYVQAQMLTPTVVAFAAVFVVVLSGIKIVDDAQDYEYDRSIGKRTVAVALGRPRARQSAYAVMAVGLVTVVALAATPVFPPSVVVAPGAFALIAFLTRHADERLATMLLIRASYVFLAVLVVAVWFQPLS
ncbi:MAG: UbiA family prenyltransferase [Halobacteriota archaeon]